jgi:hypothetical protein
MKLFDKVLPFCLRKLSQLNSFFPLTISTEKLNGLLYMMLEEEEEAGKQFQTISQGVLKMTFS